mmetsp:Transcript_70148/g.116521  ORF Transcript_70148/g.116521 Transcript_70148/m.116521 type:complete len:156 (+) Transcript_70148:67-534(+)|eukprot:CAMPEP_0119337270 /NCGR_PEP_ID=MMETSP1333-20130426/93616_1 /TAXON_ID=418940 /ORGANISM="Scyphosphaera apsteinii, Strain RCC1455" /LENGTH=155 /DNA_ID=CAMNT_0007348277 /DNA_START=61 /DNA_END=528 /DNA_ORIENTATION=+
MKRSNDEVDPKPQRLAAADHVKAARKAIAECTDPLQSTVCTEAIKDSLHNFLRHMYALKLTLHLETQRNQLQTRETASGLREQNHALQKDLSYRANLLKEHRKRLLHWQRECTAVLTNTVAAEMPGSFSHDIEFRCPHDSEQDQNQGRDRGQQQE